MQYLLLRQIKKCNHNLLDQKVHFAFAQESAHLDQIIEICPIVVIHDNVVCTLGRDDVVNLDQVRMLQFDQYLHLLHHAFVLRVILFDEISLNTLGT